MRGRRTAPLVVATTLAGAALAGCVAPSVEDLAGARDDPPAQEAGPDPGPSDDLGGGALAAPDADGGGGALGAPVRIPREVQDFGRPLAAVWAEIEQGLREQCGGDLCVELVLEESAEGYGLCQFIETQPLQQSVVARGSTVVVVAGTEPCDDEGRVADGARDEPTDGATGEATGEATSEATEEATDGGTDVP